MGRNRKRYINQELKDRLGKSFGVCPYRDGITHKRIDLTTILKILFALNEPRNATQLIMGSNIRHRQSAFNYIRFCSAEMLISRKNGKYFRTVRGDILLEMFIS